MAQNQKRYIQFYTPGTAAVKVDIQDEQTWAPLPEPKSQSKIPIYADPVSALGILVAVCMLILMAVGINQLNSARREVVALEQYVAQLAVENQELKETYQAGYRLEEVRQQALDMGMVPAESIPQNHIYVTMPQLEIAEEQTLWTQLTTFLTRLFA